MTTIGLRVDVDTLRGTREGVPPLLATLARHDLKATFYFSLGPDNMGRHAWRLLRPAFAAKMLRSRAGQLYGWQVLFAGTLWPGRQIGQLTAPVMRAAADAGHEIGVHAWDHHFWQRHATRLPASALQRQLALATDQLAQITGQRPATSAAAGWICTEQALQAKKQLGFAFNSDCRGRSAFIPAMGGREYAPQVPTTLPTYDELIGRNGVDDRNYNQRLLELIRPGQLNVLTIHAEVEGMHCAAMFDEFLRECRRRGHGLAPLGRLAELAGCAERDALVLAPIAGREGDVAWQRSALAAAA